MKTLLLVLPILVFFTPIDGQAGIDMRNANFYDSWTDLLVPGKNYDLKLERTYSSRTLFVGMFGFGWCTRFESNLAITTEGNLVLTECGGGQEIKYYPKNFNMKSISQTVDEIIKKAKGQNANLGKKYFSDIEDRMLADTSFRKKMAKTFRVNKKKLKGKTFYAENASAEKIEFDGSFYTRTLAGGAKQKFDRQGKLIYLYDTARNYMKISYRGALISTIVDSQARKLSFQHNKSGRVKVIRAPSNVSLEFKYSGENLTHVTNAWGNKYVFEYDNGHNLVKLSYPDGTHRKLTYNQDTDWVTSYRDRNGCVEKFNYLLSQNPKNNYSSTSVKTCAGKLLSTTRYEFWYKKRKDNMKYLSRVKTKINNITKDFSLNPYTGQPISLQENNLLFSYRYYPNNLLKIRTQRVLPKKSYLEEFYEYETKHYKVSSLRIQSFNEKGKVTKSKKSTYKYNKQAHLIQAKNSSGLLVDITYNKSGLAKKLLLNKKQSFSVSYAKKSSSLPSRVSSPKVGSIDIAYNTEGEIQSIKSTGGPSVAKALSRDFARIVALIDSARPISDI